MIYAKLFSAFNPPGFLTRLVIAACCLCLLPFTAAAGQDGQHCSAHLAQWMNPDNGAVLAAPGVFDEVEPIVLLGEVHDSAAHHRWQHYVITALHSRDPRLVIGLEMFPRRVQPVLDDWSAGELDEDEFLERSGWNAVWGYDSDLYLPILRFARDYRLPLVALNVDRELVSKIGSGGWDSVDAAEREGVSRPAPASADYRRRLAELFAFKMAMRAHGDDETDGAIDVDEVMQTEDFANFVEAQLTWDRAMAEALATARELDPEAKVVAIVGRGHAEYGHGIPHQLADIGADPVSVLLPIDAVDDCTARDPGLADAVFIVEATERREPPPRPLLGVLIEDGDHGVRVREVVEGGVAEAAGIRSGDEIRSAAGFDTRSTQQLVDVIGRQAPGTWLPLGVWRDGELLDVVARFPQRFD